MRTLIATQARDQNLRNICKRFADSRPRHELVGEISAIVVYYSHVCRTLYCILQYTYVCISIV